MTDLLRRQRKYTLALILAFGGLVGLFLGKMDGGSFALLATGLMGAYGAANVMAKIKGGE